MVLDTKGPEIWTGLTKGSGTAEVKLKKGAALRITLDNTYMEKGDENILWLDSENICKGWRWRRRVPTEVEDGGSLGSKKGVNPPGASVDFPATSEKDLKFGVGQDVDMVFVPFIHKAADVHEVRKVLGEKGEDIKILSKVENMKASAG